MGKHDDAIRQQLTTMGQRQKLWAKTARTRLIMALGSKCSVCHVRHGLTFDCLTPRGSAHHDMESSARMCFYRKEARAGNLGLLCSACNAMKQAWPLSVWLDALQHIAVSEAILRLTLSPGRDTVLSSLEKRECLKAAGSRFLAIERERRKIIVDK